MTTTMSIAISTPTSSLLHSSSSSSSSSRKIPSLCSFSNSAVSIPKNAIFQHIKCVPHLGLTPFCQWNGLKNMGLSISYSVKIERKGKSRGKGVYASLFGVGAPEVLVIGVVALLVFGPKGLAEVARNLGKTLRAFQPTIRELQEVSREFKSTLEREIGLDDIDTPSSRSSSSSTTQPTPGTNIEPNGSSPETSEDPADSSIKMRADQFKASLAQLQKEQAEERQKEEEKLQGQVEESQIASEDTTISEEKLQGQVEESQTTSEDTTISDTSEAPVTPESPVTPEVPVTPEARDTTEETPSVTPPPENPDNKVLQEAAAVAPTSAAANTETQS